MDNYNSKFHTKSGWLKIYSLACGYMEFYEIGETTFTLFLDCLFHVRISKKYQGVTHWETFDNLQDARKFFTMMIKKETKNDNLQV